MATTLSEPSTSSGQQNQSDEYFTSYEDPEIHRLMINDKPRTEAYRDAILKNQHLFKGKTIMDVGAGTGILSLFIASAGARKVYSVEASSMASLISDVAKENRFENVISVLAMPVEDVVLEDDEKVDVIVSEWMGFYLLHESMLNSVLIARDKFLSPDGKMFPSEARLYASPCSLVNLYEEHIDYWDSVYGFKMSTIKNLVTRKKMIKPEVCIVPPSDLLSEPVLVKTLLLDSFCLDDIKKITETSFVGITRAGLYQGLCLWFECDFDGREYNEDGEESGMVVTLSTSPFSPATHWKQTVILFGNLSDSLKDENKKESKDVPQRKESGICMSDELEVENTIRRESQDSNREINIIDNDLQMEDERNYRNNYEVEEDNVVGWRLNLQPSVENSRHYNLTFEMLDPEEEEHPIPCGCPMSRCVIIAKMIEKEDEECEQG